MMLRVVINLDNAAFAGCNCGDEIERVLAKLGASFIGASYEALAGRGYDTELPLFDSNGNRIGKATIRE